MRLIAAACAATALSVSPPALAQVTAVSPVGSLVETCLRQNAPRVVAASTSLVDAADFLLENVCAVQVAEEVRRIQRERMQRMYARAREQMCENGQPTAAALERDPGDDADTAAYAQAVCSDSGPWSADSIEETAVFMASAGDATPEHRALAAELILQARAAQR